MTLKLLNKYNEELQKPSSHVGVALGIDLRRYFKNNVISIGNYSSMDMFLIRNKELNDMPKLAKKLKGFKKKSIGLGFVFQLLLNKN